MALKMRLDKLIFFLKEDLELIVQDLETKFKFDSDGFIASFRINYAA